MAIFTYLNVPYEEWPMRKIRKEDLVNLDLHLKYSHLWILEENIAVTSIIMCGESITALLVIIISPKGTWETVAAEKKGKEE